MSRVENSRPGQVNRRGISSAQDARQGRGIDTTDNQTRRWVRYVARLTWRQGHLDQSCWIASLRGASLNIPPDDLFETLCALVTQAGDTPKPEKIQSQIERAYAFVEVGGDDTVGCLPPVDPTGAPATPRLKFKASFEPKTLGKVASQVDVTDIADLVMRKSANTPAYLRPGDYLDTMYRDGERIVIFTRYKSQGQIVWERGLTPAHELPTGGPEGVWFLPNPVDGEYHPNPRQAGKLSRRSEESVILFRYAVLESDEAPAAEWLKLLVQLPLPIESICESGGRSVHALLRVDAQSKQEWDAIIKPAKPLLTRLGADPGALSAVRLSRLPQAFRGEREQRLLYVNPGATSTPIMDRPDRPFWRDWMDWANLMRNEGFTPTFEDASNCSQMLTPFATEPKVLECLAWLAGFTGGKAVGP